MAISIDWKNRIIFIPKNDTTLVQLLPSEIRDLDLNWLRVQLKNLEDSEIGMSYPDTHRHNTEVTIGGLTYARVIEIINDFTITIEDGQYSVNLIGANSNVGDKVNVNQVSVRSNNSAGMTSSAAVEYASYNNCVTLNVNSGFSGTTYPIGTLQKPVNNLTDALSICAYRGFNTITLLSNVTVNVIHNIDNLIIRSTDWYLEIHIELGASCYHTTFEKLSVFGTVSGIWNVFIDCWIYTVDNFCGWMIGGSFTDITLAPYNDEGLGQSWFDNLVPMYPNIPAILIMNTNTEISCTGLDGAYEIQNMDAASLAEIGFDSGTLIINASCTGGTIVAIGNGILVNNSSNVSINIDGLISKDTISQAVWDESLAVHTVGGTPGKALAITAFNGAINIDSDLGLAGVTFPSGTTFNPVSNFTDAIIMSTSYKFNTFRIHGTHLLPSNLTSTDFIAMHGFIGDIVNINNRSIEHSRFRNLKIIGTFSTTSHEISFYDCYLENVSNLQGEASNTRLSGSITIAPGKIFSGVSIVVEGDNTVINLQNAANTAVSLDVNSGIITFINAVNTCLIELNLRGGEIVLTDSCVGGEFYAEGYGTLYNESNMTIKDNHLLALETIPPYILNSIASDYITNNTIGKAINDAAVGGGGGGIDEAGVHTALDSYTHKDLYKANISTLATKTDIQALNNPTVSDIVTAVWNHSKANQISSDVLFIKNIEGGKWEIVNNQMIFFKEDNITEIARFNLYDEEGVLANTNIFTRLRV